MDARGGCRIRRRCEPVDGALHLLRGATSHACISGSAGRGLLSGRTHLIVSAVLIGVALVLPFDDLFFYTSDAHAPVLLALQPARHALEWALPLAVAAGLVIMTLAAIVFSRRNRAIGVITIAVGLSVGASASASLVVADLSRTEDRSVPVHAPASLVAFPGADPISVMSTLFWNPALRNVYLVGGARGDGFAAIPAEIAPGGAISADGRGLAGPLVLDADDTLVRLRGPKVHRQGGLLLRMGQATGFLSSEKVGHDPASEWQDDFSLEVLLRNDFVAASCSVSAARAQVAPTYFSLHRRRC